VQTKKIQPFPIVLYGNDYWKGLIDWFKNTLIPAGTLSESDLEHFTIVDTVEDICGILLRHCEVHEIELSKESPDFKAKQS
jgi:predicted Rossmann-fold nucleotide-binding protein